MNRLFIPRRASGFTLIELALVMVIIGLVVGGVVVGKSLVDIAALNSTISQITKYNAAANTFRVKYGGLPGDLATATNFGFFPRGPNSGQGDGDGNIEAGCYDDDDNHVSACGVGYLLGYGETAVFWRDLSDANMIDSKFDSATQYYSGSGASYVPKVLPKAKIGRSNYIYVWSGGMDGNNRISESGKQSGTVNGLNYFGMSAVSDIANGGWQPYSKPALTVAEAYMIDSKADDGLPQAGRVQAMYITRVTSQSVLWAAGGGNLGAGVGWQGGHGPTTAATPRSDTTCYDNDNTNGTIQHYSMAQDNGNGINCALSFRFE